MEQLYFLLIVFNTLAGIILASEAIREKVPAISKFIELIAIKEIKFIIGIGSLIVGVIKLIAPVGFIIIGDLIPAVSSGVMGITLLVDFYKDNTTIKSETINKLDNTFLKNKTKIGLLGLLVALLHFFFDWAPILL